MRVIVVGCEYAGKSSLIQGLIDWGQARQIRFHPDDHFSIPDCQTLRSRDDQEVMANLPQSLKERFQRFQIVYHVRLLKKYRDILLGGFHIEEAVYGLRYYCPDAKRMVESPRAYEAEMPPDTLLVHLIARPDVIRKRMQEGPHTFPIVPANDVEEVLQVFEQEYHASLIRRKFQIDTSDLTPGSLLETFLDASMAHLSTRDLLVRKAVG